MTKPTPEELQVAESFVHLQHVLAIAIATDVANCAVTFRSAGAATLQRIALGAPCKGHDVAEKTIKASSLRKAYGADVQLALADIRAAGIEGCVGHWDSSGRLAGVYVSCDAGELESSDDPAERDLARHLEFTSDGLHRYYPIQPAKLKKSLSALKAVDDWEKLVPTGDYDTHDMLNFSGKRGPVPSKSSEEQFIIDAINVAVSAADPELRPFDKQRLRVVQHGPQYNYVAQMMSEERGEPLVGAVARPEFPLALCDRGRWRIVKTQEKLDAFYAEIGLKVKSTWRRSGLMGLEDLAIDERFVALSRRGSAADDK